MSEEEYLEYINYVNSLNDMSNENLVIELNDYLNTIKDMKKRLWSEKKALFIIKMYFTRRIIPKYYLSNICECVSGICYESFYIDIIKKYINTMLKSKDYSDTPFIFKSLVDINQIGNYRDYYISRLLSYDNKNNNDDIRYKLIFNYNNISCNINKILKKVK